MKEFFKFTLASLLGTFLAGIVLFFVVGIIIIGGIISSASQIGKSEPVSMKAHTVLQLSFDHMIAERGRESEFDNLPLPGGFGTTRTDGLDDIIENIEKAAKDKNVDGIYLDLSVVMGGWATIKEIRDELIEYKKSGKWIIAYGEVFSQGAYYLATVADKVYMHPEGGMELSGLGGNITFFKKALDKYGVEMQVIRGKNNKFKSAVEPFLYDKMSDANREQTELYLKGLWGVALDGISSARKISVEQLNHIADSMPVQQPDVALKLGLIDGLKYKDEVYDELKQKTGAEDYDDINFISLRRYKKTGGNDDEPKTKERLAVIYADGGIEDGKGDESTIGSETLSEAIRDARLDSKVKAVVIRVNSPGGSALASDVIWREVKLCEKVKPVVVSFGDVAASGGYYISAAADKIFAQPNTITGSIGVFGVLPNAQKLANDFGVTFDGVRTNKHSDLGSPFRPLSPEEYAIIQQGVEKIYDKFLTVVADGRHLTKEYVDSIGQGRVWCATDAKRIGLVDEIGSLEDAIAYAAKLAKLGDYKITKLPKLKDPFLQLISDLTGEELETRYVEHKLQQNFNLYQQYKYFEEISKMKGIQMRMPFVLVSN